LPWNKTRIKFAARFLTAHYAAHRRFAGSSLLRKSPACVIYTDEPH
jgi:hypothetical protein